MNKLIFTTMKKFLMCVPAVMLAMLTSCGDDTVLTAGAAEDAVTMNVMWENPIDVRSFEVGEYMASEEKVEVLTSLQNAKVITFKKKKDDWGGYLVNVSLTEEGKKHLYAGEIMSLREDYLDEIPEVKNGEYPEYVTKALKSVLDKEDSVDRMDAIRHLKGEIKYFSNEKQNKEDKSYYVNVVCGKISVADVKEIRCTEEDAKNGVGTAKVVFEYSDVTPFGIVRGYKNGDKQSEVLSFKRYEDLGWVLASEL